MAFSSLKRTMMLLRVRSCATLRSVGDGIIATGTAGEIVFMNPVAEELTGWSAADARGRLLMEIIALVEESSGQPARNPILGPLPWKSRCYKLSPRDGVDTVVEIQCFENRAPATSMRRTPPMDTARSAQADSTAGGPAASGPDDLLGAIVVLRDCTARRLMEGRLMQSQRMEAVADMAGGLANDFNNLLTVILECAGDLCAQVEGESKAAALEIQQAATAAASITGQLLMLSRRGEARFEVLDVNGVICEMQPTIAHSLGKIRTLETVLGSPPGSVRCDRNQLKQVLLNLALNARDAMPAGGELRIESSTVEIAPGSPEAQSYRPGQFVRLRVSDTGEGMDKATLARIFEPFFSTKKGGLANGLGLSVAHGIIVQSQGFIRAKSAVGHGTSFEILLPCVGTFRRIGEGGGLQRAPGEDSTPTVLLVEEDDDVRGLMHKFLEREGYQLLEAQNAAEAEAIAEVYPEPIHVLVTDVLMPGMTGEQLAARLKPLRPTLKTLLVSGNGHDVLEPPARPRGDMTLLSKPFPAAELLRRVCLLLEPAMAATRKRKRAAADA